ncbi:MAG: phage portal protein [Verrucomicrobia bacterium]|nr:phage portal protein [Verrucomicrobiota bacterium]NBU11161.1 phage portal protein [Pseudomonadota bacterium]NDA67385.1 phage portal protein [Verrucomicrobiota bacterium]NDB76158.1 phage portal protein [Verrucomicrobiota bacterium]NDD39170.1 phage portal protein [Verrucomicrobiota bacterium]
MNIIERLRVAARVSRNLMTLPSAALAPGTYNEAGIKLLSGEWEGGQNSRLRRSRRTRLVSHDTDLNYGTREFLMSKARSLRQNTPLPGAILRRYADYCVHPQAMVQWITGDHDWDMQMQDAWAAWTRTCDATGENTLPQILRTLVESSHCDGDAFLHKERDGEELKVRGIEADRITNAKGGTVGFDNVLPSNVPRDVGGVWIDAQGRKRGFTVCDRTGWGAFTNPRYVDATEFLHYHHSERFESYRGVSSFAAVINSLDDLKETIEAEQLAQKIASNLTILERNALGAKMGPQALADGATDNAGNTQKLEDMAAGIMRYMAHGDDLSMFTSERPAEGWRWLVEFTIRGISLGIHLPYEIVWNLSGLTGTSVRLVSKMAERTFNAEMDNLERRVIDPLACWFACDQMERGLIARNPNWMFFQALRPAYITADVGRESSANLAELNAGCRTEESICREQGWQGVDVRTARAGEVRHRIQLATQISEETGGALSMKEVLAMMGGANIGPTYGMQSPAPAKDAKEKP